MIVLVLLTSLLVMIAAYQVRFVVRRRRLSNRSWQEIFARLEPIDLAGVRAIAACYLQPDKDQLSVEPATMWESVGGFEGLARLRANAAVMLELAVYAERWNEEQGPVIAEMIRRDAVRLNRAVTRIEVSLVSNLGWVRAPFYLQEVSAAYFLMRGRLLGLYQSAHAGLLPQLEAAI